jgi:Icc-related predicted phosphoesterase
MKVLYVTDLHGDRNKYDKTIDLAKHYKVDIVINGGDMLPNSTRSFSKTIYEAQSYFLMKYLDSYFGRLNDLGIKFLGMLGNDDYIVFDSRFESYTKKYINIYTTLAENCIEIDGYEFIGMNFVCDYHFCLKDRCRLDYKEWNPPMTQGYPFKTSDQGNITLFGWESIIKKYPTLKDELRDLPKPKDYNKVVIVTHDPPSNLGLDVCYTGLKVGSRSVLEFICEKKPMLTLHGHIHESPKMSGVWKVGVNNTICIQPGQKDYDLTYVIIELNNYEVNAERYTWRIK